MKPDVVYDVPRVPANDPDGRPEGTAIIADPRNDQTEIILQLHVAMQKFHNRLVDTLRASRNAAVGRVRVGSAPGPVALPVDRDPRVHARHRGADHVRLGVQGSADRGPEDHPQVLQADEPGGRSFIPVEFAVAAYRFGHSITRPRYTVRDVFDSTGTLLGSVSGVPLFGDSPTDNNLNGHRELLPRLKIQWSKFFNVGGAEADSPASAPVRRFAGQSAVQAAHRRRCPTPTTLGLLSQRNLRRGRKMGLPSGQQVARLMGVTPLTPTQLWTNHRIEVEIPIVGNVVKVLQEYDEENQSLKDLFADPEWGGEAPLWFYILKEAEIVGKGREMGPVGGRIIAEVLVGLLQKDPNSYLYLQSVLEAHDTHSAGPAASSPWPTSSSTPGLVLTKEVMNVPKAIANVLMNRLRTDVNEVMKHARDDRERVIPPAHGPADRSSRAGSWLQ